MRGKRSESYFVIILRIRSRGFVSSSQSELAAHPTQARAEVGTL